MKVGIGLYKREVKKEQIFVEKNKKTKINDSPHLMD